MTRASTFHTLRKSSTEEGNEAKEKQIQEEKQFKVIILMP
jgi:hypothetical protein